MKKITALFLSLILILASMTAITAAAEDTLEIENIAGNKRLISVTFTGAPEIIGVTVSDTMRNALENTYTVSENTLTLTMADELEIDKRYVLTIATAGKAFERYISFETLYEDDFENPEKTKQFISFYGNDIKDGCLARISWQYMPTWTKAGVAADWSDYTVEFDWLDNKSSPVTQGYKWTYDNGVTYTQEYTPSLFVLFYVPENKTSGHSVEYSDNKRYYALGTGTWAFADGASKCNILYNSEEVPGIINKVEAPFRGDYNSIKGRESVRFSAGLIKNTAVVSVKDGSEELCGFEYTVPKLGKTSGKFAINAFAANAYNAGPDPYIDNLLVYKLKASLVEYVPSIASGAKNLYDVNELTLNWNYEINPLTKDNIEFFEDGTAYTDFTVTGDSAKTVITFNTPFKGERNYLLKFKNVTTASETLYPMDLSFSTGGICEKIDITGNNALKVGESSIISVKGTTDKGTVYDIDNENIEYTSDNEDVISVSADGAITAKDRGSAVITAKFTDTNVSNTNGDNGDNIFIKKIHVYSYMSETGLADGADFSFKDGAFIAEFTDNLTDSFKIGFGENKPEFKTTENTYEIAGASAPKAAGDHKLEILKTDGKKLNVYLDGEKLLSDYAVENCDKLTVSGNFKSAKVYNLIG